MPGLANLIGQLGVGGAFAILILIIVFYFQNKNLSVGKGFARAGEIAEICDDVKEVRDKLVEIRTLLIGMNGNGGMLWEIERLREWREYQERKGKP